MKAIRACSTTWQAAARGMLIPDNSEQLDPVR